MSEHAIDMPIQVKATLSAEEAKQKGKEKYHQYFSVLWAIVQGIYWSAREWIVGQLDNNLS